ncbi:MAG: DNA-3-methyladenine glycosylase [Firmicutes bacterium]|nr:DNA-3-methyladenine glycosylase [Bacillota bacterium]
MRIDRQFFAAPILEVAPRLLGLTLVRRSPLGDRAGIIVETEAYTANDPACHAYRGKSRRNAAMFGPAGTAYIYFIYGMHYCFNVVTGREGSGEAVLIRALEPVKGISLMAKARGTDDIRLLCSGPARLCQALNITLAENGISLMGDTIFLQMGRQPEAIVTASRIGVSAGKELPYRFYIAGNEFVSKK